MNVVYISQVYLNFTPGSQAHQVFVSGKARDQSKWPALNQQTIRLENGGSSNAASLAPRSRSPSEPLLNPNHGVERLLPKCPFWPSHGHFLS